MKTYTKISYSFSLTGKNKFKFTKNKDQQMSKNHWKKDYYKNKYGRKGGNKTAANKAKVKPKALFQKMDEDRIQLSLVSDLRNSPILRSLLNSQRGVVRVSRNNNAVIIPKKHYLTILDEVRGFVGRQKDIMGNSMDPELYVSPVNDYLIEKFTKALPEELKITLYFTDGKKNGKGKSKKIMLMYRRKVEPLFSTDLISETTREEMAQKMIKNIEKFNLEDSESTEKLKQAARKIAKKACPTDLFSKLYPFQKEGVMFGVAQKGRFLLADEMGVGKTIQALALAAVYKINWPCLILCPASLKFNWKDEALKWLKDIVVETQVQVLGTGKENIYKTSQIVIISYDLAKRIPAKVRAIDFGVVIADEAHMLKNSASQRYRTLNAIIKKSKRVLLLTGTPALAHPFEMFTLLEMLRPDCFDKPKEFGDRYCDPRYNKFTRKFEYKGAKNELELNYILKHLMLRRLKKDVLSDLPSKSRHRFPVESDPKILKEIKSIKNELSDNGVDLGRELDKMIDNKGGGGSGRQQDAQNQDLGFQNNNIKQEGLTRPKPNIHKKKMTGFQIRQHINKLYKLSGEAKVKSICQFLDDMLEYKSKKFVFFAHHRALIQAVEEHYQTKHKSKGYIKITGDTPSEKRNDLVKEFQQELTEKQKEDGKGGVRLAILSITAASVGLTLTQSSVVIFGELYWTPALIVQAEDRCHRISQESNVTVYYLMGKETIDDQMYEKIKLKFDTVSKILDGENAQIYRAKKTKSVFDAQEDSKSRTINQFFGVKKYEVSRSIEAGFGGIGRRSGVMSKGSRNSNTVGASGGKVEPIDDIEDLDLDEFVKDLQKNDPGLRSEMEKNQKISKRISHASGAGFGGSEVRKIKRSFGGSGSRTEKCEMAGKENSVSAKVRKSGLEKFFKKRTSIKSDNKSSGKMSRGLRSKESSGGKGPGGLYFGASKGNSPRPSFFEGPVEEQKTPEDTKKGPQGDEKNNLSREELLLSKRKEAILKKYNIQVGKRQVKSTASRPTNQLKKFKENGPNEYL